MEDQSEEKKIDLQSLAAELKEKIKKESSSKRESSKKEDLIVEEASNRIGKKESEAEARELKKLGSKEGKIKSKIISTDNETLIPLEDYIKCAVHLGTKVITPHMRKYVYKRRADGLAVINTIAIDEKLREAVEFIKDHAPEDIYIVCKREAGWNPAKKFAEATGMRVFTKKYPPGITTNLELDNFFENELTIICDPWIDKNALVDTARLKKPVLSLCDTNNFTTNITKLIPCNNKSGKSIGCILFILAREYCKKRKIDFNYSLEDFTGSLE